MKHFMTALSFACAVAACAPEALADWQYTRWRMTPTDVVRASQNMARPNHDWALDSNDLTTRLVAPYQAGRHQFEAGFIFDHMDKLRVVNLKLLAPGQCPGLYGDLTSTYGPPRDRNPAIGLSKWWDRTNNNVIALLEISQRHCSIQYAPYAAPGAPGGL